MICRDCGIDKDLETAFRSTYTRKDGTKSYRPSCEECDTKARTKRNTFSPWVGREQYRKLYDKKRSEDRKSGVERDRWIFTDCRNTDKKKGLQNDLNREFIKTTIATGCSYCGETEIRIGLDRIDNAKGHTKDNVRAACMRCNYLRRDMPFAAWLTIVPAIRAAREAGLFGDWGSKSFR
jgi:hypothetical protein